MDDERGNPDKTQKNALERIKLIDSKTFDDDRNHL
jgi:hypothetical protein